MSDGKWRVLYKWRRGDAKRFRRSPTYICTRAATGTKEENIQLLGCVPCDKVYDSYIKLTDDEIRNGPKTTETYYTKENGAYIQQENLTSFADGQTYYRIDKKSDYPPS
jgi:hypothetical protein